MKRILIFLLAVNGLQQANAQTNIYNPDANDDGFISAEDLLIFLTFFESDFTPNPCNCGCYSNPFYEPYEVQDTITAYEMASNLFYSQPDSIRLDIVISPYGLGELPFLEIDSLGYDTLTFSQTFPLKYFGPTGHHKSGYGEGVPISFYRNSQFPSAFAHPIPVSHGNVSGGLDIVDNDSIPFVFEASSICPNLENDEFWRIRTETEFVRVNSISYVNVLEFASDDLPSEPSEEFPNNWSFFYPLNWLVITEIHNTPEGTE